MELSLPALLLLPLLAASPPAPAREDPRAEDEPAVLRVRDLLEPGGPGLAPSRRALALAGKRIRLLGYMVHTEEPRAGSFWLASRPVECDEGGAGLGDLPPDAVRIILRANPEPVPHVDGPLAITGVLQVGNDTRPDGETSAFRLVVEQHATSSSAKP